MAPASNARHEIAGPGGLPGSHRDPDPGSVTVVDRPDIPDVAWRGDALPHRPVMLAAFGGWNDAGDAATQAVRFLRQRMRATPLACLDSEEFFDFTVARPNVRFDDEGSRTIEWPTTDFSVATLPGTERSVIFVEGTEPQLRWKTFVSRIGAVANAVDASLVVTLGALLADVPHTRPVEVYSTSDDAEVAANYHLARSTYTGPTGIIGVLATLSRQMLLPTASLWAAVPAYVPGAGSPKAALALIERVRLLLDFAMNTTELEIAAAAYERQVTDLISDDEDTAEYVAELEAHYDSVDPPEDSADMLVAEVENFLRQQER